MRPAAYVEPVFDDEIRAAVRYERWLLAKGGAALLLVGFVILLHELVGR